MNPYKVTEDFERLLCAYTGASHAVVVSSCTAAIHLSCLWHYREGHKQTINIPKYTYHSVPMVIKHAGFKVSFRKDAWEGAYQLKPFPIIDSARWFTSGIYNEGEFRCLSFHASKTLGIEMGGAILLDNENAYNYLIKARFDGRTPGVPTHEDNFIMGWHYLMPPSLSAQGILKLYSLPKHNTPLAKDSYPDLSKQRCFQ